MKKSLIMTSLIFVAGCASGPCSNQVQNEQVTPVSSAASSPAPESTVIRIYKEDGSLQCEQTKGVSLASMEAQLKKNGIKVISSLKQPDGMMRVQVCGAPTGMANTYEINKSDLAKAEKLGFRRWQN